ncbi:hypothetical protein Tco_1375048 [Tanacetum coccineum]
MSESTKRHEENSNMIKEIRASTDDAIRNQGASTKTLEDSNRASKQALADLEASVSVMPLSTNLNLGLGELAHTKLTVELADRTVKYPKGIAKNVLVGIEARIMGETLVLNRSIDPIYGAYIEVNDLNVPLELRRYQVDDLMPTIEEGEEVKARNDARKVSIIFGYPSDYDQSDKIRINCAHNLKFSCMIDMDPYVDEGMGEVVVEKPFCEVLCVETKRFDGMITIHNNDESVTYQMVQSHPRFNHHTNRQCNKITPLLKVSEDDKMNGISHPFQKLKRFYKGVLNLGPDFIRDLTMKEWRTHGHVSVHEMEW